jgi:hypothetical protein
MRRFYALALSSAFVLAPMTASYAATGSDKPPDTAKAAVAGATSNGTIGTTVGNSTSPTSGTGGGGMSTGNGQKAGGLAKRDKATSTTPGG